MCFVQSCSCHDSDDFLSPHRLVRTWLLPWSLQYPQSCSIFKFMCGMHHTRCSCTIPALVDPDQAKRDNASKLMSSRCVQACSITCNFGMAWCDAHLGGMLPLSFVSPFGGFPNAKRVPLNDPWYILLCLVSDILLGDVFPKPSIGHFGGRSFAASILQQRPAAWSKHQLLLGLKSHGSFDFHGCLAALVASKLFQG